MDRNSGKPLPRRFWQIQDVTQVILSLAKDPVSLLKQLLLWIVLLVYAGALIYLGLIPMAPAPSLPYIDKLEHAIAYGLFAVLVCLLKKNWHKTKLLGLALALSLGHGILLELLQGLTPSREPSFWDGVADGAGALLGITIYFYARSIWKIFDRS